MRKTNKLLLENKVFLKERNLARKEVYLDAYLKYLNTGRKKINEEKDEIVPILNHAFIKNEETNQLISLLDKKLNE